MVRGRTSPLTVMGTRKRCIRERVNNWPKVIQKEMNQMAIWTHTLSYRDSRVQCLYYSYHLKGVRWSLVLTYWWVWAAMAWSVSFGSGWFRFQMGLNSCLKSSVIVEKRWGQEGTGNRLNQPVTNRFKSRQSLCLFHAIWISWRSCYYLVLFTILLV